MYSQNSLCLKKSLNSLCILFVNIALTLLSAALFVLEKIILHVYIVMMCTLFVCLIPEGSVSSATWAVRCFCCLKVKPPAFMLLIYHLHIIICLPSGSMWGIPGSAGPSPGTTKNLHLALLLLCLNFTVHVPNCSILISYNMF